MELLVLSTLNWRMNPVTPLAFVDQIVRKLPFQLEVTSNWEFFWRCEQQILSVLAGNHSWRAPPLSYLQHYLQVSANQSRLASIADVRLLGYLPSTLASAAMLCIVKEVEPFDSEALKDLLTCFLQINKVPIHINCPQFPLRVFLYPSKASEFQINWRQNKSLCNLSTSYLSSLTWRRHVSVCIDEFIEVL